MFDAMFGDQPHPRISVQEIALRDAERLTDGLEREAAHRHANNLPPFWFERLFGFDVQLWRSIINEPHK
jgi:hypothetical protein